MACQTDILDALPHRPPFRFLTRVDDVERGRVGKALWQVTGREDFFAGHFPGRPIVPGVLIGEALAQLAGLVGLHGEGRGGGGRLARIDVRFDRSVCPPAEIVLHAAVTRQFGALTEFDVQAEADGQVAARGTLTLAAAPDGPESEGTR